MSARTSTVRTQILTRATLVAVALVVGATAPATVRAQTVFSASGADAAAILGQVTAFRTALGTPNPNVAGSAASGRREINWDGVPVQFQTPNNQPPDFFNVNSPRGVVTTTPGSGVQVSANDPARFGNLNPTYATQFTTFSPPRLFTSIGSNIVDVAFFVPGSTVPAFTSAFGVVFVDVDLANTTSLQFFDMSGGSLGSFSAAAASSGLSFLGVQFAAGTQVGRVRITSGNTAIGPTENGNTDVVVMDDFIYAEPQAVVPEPSTWLLLATGLGIVGLVQRRRLYRRTT